MENSKIEWCDHTFNPWEGCAKVSPGCKNCYADSQHQLHHSSLKAQQGTCWGVNAPRLGKSADNWKKPLKWNREAQAAGIRARVFCASMADVFEGQSAASRLFIGQTAQVPCGNGKTRTVTFIDMAVERLRLLRLIYDTPHLDWLLLTKRPENIVPALCAAVDLVESQEDENSMSPFLLWLTGWAVFDKAPANVWLGTSVENQEQADIRVPQLLAAPAALRFLSCEPLLGPVNLNVDLRWALGINWVIVGGESGPRARAMHPVWARNIQMWCQAAGVPFLFKQWGEYKPFSPVETKPDGIGARGRTDWYNWPGGYVSIKLGKHEAGRELDGRTWDEVPIPQSAAR